METKILSSHAVEKSATEPAPKRHGFIQKRHIFAVKHLASKGFSLAFAKNICLCCGNPSYEVSLCPDCINNRLLRFLPADSSRCKKCGKPLLSEIELCMSCRKNCIVSHCDSVFPIHTYRLWFKSLLFTWKMQDERLLTPLFAKLIYVALHHTSLLADVALGNSIIVPVPPRPGKLKEKGWDQIDDLCKMLHTLYGFSFLCLLKRKTREQQKKKNRTKRLQSKENAFCAQKKCATILSHWAKKKCARLGTSALPQSAILLDDVLTTGATIDACAAILKSLGIQKVHALTLCIVD